MDEELTSVYAPFGGIRNRIGGCILNCLLLEYSLFSETHQGILSISSVWHVTMDIIRSGNGGRMSELAQSILRSRVCVDEDRFCHWSPESQSYAPADVLINYMRQGWILDSIAGIETFYYAGYRRVDVFYFTLRCHNQVLEMPIVANPVVTRLIEECGLTCWLHSFKGNGIHD